MDELRGGELDAVAGGDARRMQRGVLLGDGDSRLVAMLRHTGGHGHQPAAEQLIADLPLLIPGSIPESSGVTHIWMKRTGSVCRSPDSRHESFFSECRMPVPADIRCARPG